MKKTVLAVALLFAPALLAATADVRVVGMTQSIEPTTTGERFSMSLRWRNDGPDDAHFLFVSVTGSPTPYYVLNVATSGWPCYPTPDATAFTCQNAMLAAGAEAELVLTMYTPPTPGPFTLRADVHAEESDPQPANNSIEKTMLLEAAPSADLALSPVSQLHRAAAGAEVSIPISVTNNGAAEVRNLFAIFTVPVRASIPPFSGSGSGWSCLHPAYGPQVLTCTRPSLGPGETAPLSITIRAPLSDGTEPISARVRGEGHSDPDTTNDAATATVQVGAEPERWTRVMVPLTGGDIPGVGGALWRTVTTALIAADTLDILPRCEFLVECPPPPAHTPFDPRDVGLIPADGPANGHFFYTRTAHESLLRLNSRVYDASRVTETAGSEIPIVRESQFTSSPVSLLGIPVAPQYRHALRVYDLEATDGGRVLIRVFANGETTARTEVTRTLTVTHRLVEVNGEPRPINPGYLQLDLGQLLALGGVQSLRVDIQPLDAQLRLWSFVSITNNDTHHVTTFSQH